MIQGLWAFLKALPALIGILKEIFKFLHETIDYFDRLKKAKDLEQAVKEARETKDTTKLENMFSAPSNPQPAADPAPNPPAS